MERGACEFNMASVGIIFMCLILIYLTLEAQSEGESKKFIKVVCQNQTVVAQFGTNTLLDCVVQTNDKHSVIEFVTWTQNDVVLSYDGNFQNYDSSYQFAKSDTWNKTNMNVSLLITNTKLSHAGEYECEVMTDTGTGKSKVHLIVKSNYSKPVIEPDTEKITRDKGFTLTCEAHGGFPQGSIRWLVNDDVWRKNPEVEVQEDSNGLFSLTSKLSFGPSTPFTKFVCEVYSAAGIKEGQETFEYQHMDEITGSGRKGDSVAKIVAPLTVIGSMIVGLLVVLLICRRRRQHMPPAQAYPDENHPEGEWALHLHEECTLHCEKK